MHNASNYCRSSTKFYKWCPDFQVIKSWLNMIQYMVLGNCTDDNSFSLTEGKIKNLKKSTTCRPQDSNWLVYLWWYDHKSWSFKYICWEKNSHDSGFLSLNGFNWKNIDEEIILHNSSTKLCYYTIILARQGLQFLL